MWGGGGGGGGGGEMHDKRLLGYRHRTTRAAFDHSSKVHTWVTNSVFSFTILCRLLPVSATHSVGYSQCRLRTVCVLI